MIRGMAYRQRGNYERAMADLIKAVELDPDGPVSAAASSLLKRLEEEYGD